MAVAPRYAIYFAPEPDTALDRFGSHWLGRSAWDGASLQQPSVHELSNGLMAIVTESPRVYGFHATLKPPFFLRDGTTLEELESDLEQFTDSIPTFGAPPLELRRLGRFLALVLSDECPTMRALADASVRNFDCFRAPASSEETQRRKKAGLSPRQLNHLADWGYPYVLDDWQFHMSLTGSVDANLLQRAQQALSPLTRSLCEDALTVNALCLFEEAGPNLPFLIRRAFRLRGSRHF